MPNSTGSEVFMAFENLVAKIFRITGHKVFKGDFEKRLAYDLILKKNEITDIWIDVKFFRSKNVSSSTILSSSHNLGYSTQSKLDRANGILVVSCYVPRLLRREILNATNIQIIDRSALFNIIKNEELDPDILAEFERLLISAKLGIDTEEVFREVEPDDYRISHYLNFDPEKQTIYKPPEEGKKHCRDLKLIEKGKSGWSQYEDKCIEILKFLFKDDLSIWSKQQRTDDELSRFDLICRISSKNDFWNTLIQSFRSRYIMFEFKNYSDKISQDQIYTTERYLFTKALRSVCFLVTRLGGKDQALNAAKGSLREQGKLILTLSEDDICKMLYMKDKGDSPSDYLSELLDNFLISLSR